MQITKIKETAESLCREFAVKRLDVFGSTARGTATEFSDIDLLVEFIDPHYFPAKRFFGLLHNLEDTLKCGIDLYTFRSLRNPYFRMRVLKERVQIYEG
jgi:uncharacterized protein